MSHIMKKPYIGMRKRHWARKISVILYVVSFSLLFLFLAGCMYPAELRMENQLPLDAQVEMVQEAVDQYREASGGLLPIKTKEADTPIYQKYVIDFARLAKYLPYIPGSAFEQGGSYQFVLVDVEKVPTVRLLDLKMTDAVSQVQEAIDAYWMTHHRLPVILSDSRYEDFYNIDFSLLGREVVQVQSPYSGHYLPLMVDLVGHVGVDYAMDLGQIIRESSPEKLAEWEKTGDLLSLWVEKSIFVPAHSFPYSLENGQPVPKMKES